MSEGRKTIQCSKCCKDKLHFGLGMCSACLRNYKRKTRPSFYLGTCYSEMSRRVKVFDPKRPNYFGMAICTKNEFIQKFKDDAEFLKQFNIWQKSNFKRGYAPSIDRINNEGGYDINNLQFLSHHENSTKDSKIKHIVYLNGAFFGKFDSMTETALAVRISEPTILKSIRTGKAVKGFTFARL